MLNYNFVVAQYNPGTSQIEMTGEEIAKYARAGFPILVTTKYAEYGSPLPDTADIAGAGEIFSLGPIIDWLYDEGESVWVFNTSTVTFTCSDLSEFPTVSE